MTKRVTVSLPDDVATYLENADNASAAVTEALRAQIDRGAATERMLQAAGFEVTEAGKARVRAALPPLGTAQRAEISRRRELLRTGDWPAESPA